MPVGDPLRCCGGEFAAAARLEASSDRRPGPHPEAKQARAMQAEDRAAGGVPEGCPRDLTSRGNGPAP
jgi:hypothetical protein